MTVSSSPKHEQQWLLLLAAVQFSHVLDFMMVMPLGPALMQRFALTASQFGALVSAYTLASAAMGLVGGFWLDRFERKRALLLLYAGFIAATLACGVSGSHAALLLARALAGACAGLMGAVSMAIIGDLVPGERRGRAIGTVMTAYALSAVAGVPLGLGLAHLLGWRAPFWAVGGLAGVVWLCLLKALPTVDAHLKAPRGDSRLASPWAVGSQGLALGWLLTFAVVFSGFLLIPYLSPFMVGNLGVSQAELPWVYLCGGAATLLSSRVIGQWVDRRGPSQLLAALLVGTVVPYLVFTHLARAPLPVVILLFVLFMTLTSGRQIPTLALLTARVPPTLRGRYLAINMAASDGASGLAAWVSGRWLETASGGALIGFGQVGWAAVAVSFLALCTLWAFGRNAVSLSTAQAPVP